MSGNQIPALTLAAGEQKSSQQDSAYQQTPLLRYLPLTMCVGSGEDETCQTVQLQFIATSVVTETDHQRSMPENTLQWNVIADLPASSGILDWKVSDAGRNVR